MERLGTNYGGWYVPINMNLNERVSFIPVELAKTYHLIYYLV